MTRAGNALGLAVIAVALVEAMAIALFLLVPEKREYWLIAALTMPILWTGAELMKRDKTSIRFTVAYAATILALAQGFAITRAMGMLAPDDESAGLRVLGIAAGLVIVGYGNLIPKKALCTDPASPGAARRQAVQRYSAWVFVLAGLANTLIWTLAPIEQAALLSMAPLAAGLSLIALRIGRARTQRRSEA